jgi:hypothetical protein
MFSGQVPDVARKFDLTVLHVHDEWNCTSPAAKAGDHLSGHTSGTSFQITILMRVVV